MVDRYARGLDLTIGQVARVSKPEGQVVMVVGNSCLKENYIKNSEAVKSAADIHGLVTTDEKTRKLPDNRRYLPVQNAGQNGLKKRMRKEHVITLKKLLRIISF